MTDQVEAQDASVVDEPAVTLETVTTPEDGTETQQDEVTQAEEKTFTQAELDKILTKRIAKAERVAEQRALKVYADKLETMGKPAQQQQQQQQQADDKPTLKQFQNVEDYVEAVADWKMSQRDRAGQKANADQQYQAVMNKSEKIYAEAEKIDGFDRDAFEVLEITTPIAQAIIESDVAAKLMAHLAANPEEVKRIGSLSPARQAAEIGKLEVKLSVAKEIKVSKTPAPIKPIGTRGGEIGKKIEDMTMDEYAEHEKKRGARWSTR